MSRPAAPCRARRARRDRRRAYRRRRPPRIPLLRHRAARPRSRPRRCRGAPARTPRSCTRPRARNELSRARAGSPRRCRRRRYTSRRRRCRRLRCPARRGTRGAAGARRGPPATPVLPRHGRPRRRRIAAVVMALRDATATHVRPVGTRVPGRQASCTQAPRHIARPSRRWMQTPATHPIVGAVEGHPAVRRRPDARAGAAMIAVRARVRRRAGGAVRRKCVTHPRTASHRFTVQGLPSSQPIDVPARTTPAVASSSRWRGRQGGRRLEVARAGSSWAAAAWSSGAARRWCRDLRQRGQLGSVGVTSMVATVVVSCRHRTRTRANARAKAHTIGSRSDHPPHVHSIDGRGGSRVSVAHPPMPPVRGWVRKRRARHVPVIAARQVASVTKWRMPSTARQEVPVWLADLEAGTAAPDDPFRQTYDAIPAARIRRLGFRHLGTTVRWLAVLASLYAVSVAVVAGLSGRSRGPPGRSTSRGPAVEEGTTRPTRPEVIATAPARTKTTVHVGDAVDFAVSADGSDLHYGWTLDGQPAGTGPRWIYAPTTDDIRHPTCRGHGGGAKRQRLTRLRVRVWPGRPPEIVTAEPPDSSSRRRRAAPFGWRFRPAPASRVFRSPIAWTVDGASAGTGRTLTLHPAHAGVMAVQAVASTPIRRSRAPRVRLAVAATAVDTSTAGSGADIGIRADRASGTRTGRSSAARGGVAPPLGAPTCHAEGGR